jgi:diaminohydroxyphosphoribosylaminopyrimidine deaminase/5-amino-6-(5-phosphoribosylamino)uracil reductase
MHRCLQLAKLGAGNVAPNPMVGAVLVHGNKIIGEGWHQKYGEAHAEVNCINQAIQNGHNDLIAQSTLYVSLEPCAHFGKTPPCTDLIIKHKIPGVVIGCRDPFKEVNARLNDAVGQGRGIEKLKAAGVEVINGVLENESKDLNKRFFTFHTQCRPYIILKWAQTADGFIASPPNSKSYYEFEDSNISPSGGGAARLLISNEYSNRLVHKWRSEEAAILVGTNTVIHDDPELTTRLWTGNSPIRLVVDMDLRLPSSLKIFNKKASTIIFNTKIHSEESEWSNFPSLQSLRRMDRGQRAKPLYWQVTEEASLVHQIVNALYKLKTLSVIVEGGAKLLQSFIDEGMWDETRVITNRQLTLSNNGNVGKGLATLQLQQSIKIEEQTILSDVVEIFKPAGV